MTIETKYSLIGSELDLLKCLVNECQIYDKTTPEMHWPLLKEPSRFASIFFIKKNHQLIGFLKLFFFYPNAAEMILLVHPKHRQQKIATQLLQAAKPLLVNRNSHQLRFSFKDKTCGWLQKHKANYSYSDHFLSHSFENTTLNKDPVITATSKDIDKLLILDKLCFKEPTLTLFRVIELLNQKNYDIFVIKNNSQVIAKIHINHHKQTSEIFDVAVHPSHQRHGYATSLLKYALTLAKNKQKKAAILNVSAHNKQALSLYLNNGFELKSTKYYWVMKL